jgi:hypothetical protein
MDSERITTECRNLQLGQSYGDKEAGTLVLKI